MLLIWQRFKQLWSLVVGLSITARYFFAPTLTTHYPRQTVGKEASDSFRGPIELVPSPKDAQIPKCISCLLCVTACPSGCISVSKSPAPVMNAQEQKAFDEAVERGEKPKKPAAPKNPAAWVYDFSRCSLCATCVEVCPVDSIRFSHDIYIAGTSRDDFIIDQLARLRRLAAKTQAAEAVLPDGLVQAGAGQQEASA